MTFRRCDWADIAEPATSKMFINEGMRTPYRVARTFNRFP
ncbi:hypothetical protein BPC006_I0263 [Burkholderia pseudomallei BPC006]|nr:hypothetical protein BPC006_I0263 [Burkholderia pseudomallei BPC006]